jgi:hypothetical protein
MRRVVIAVGVVVAWRFMPRARFPEVVTPLATTEELSTPVIGGRA